jgi:penicillin-binding protein 1C
MELIYPKPSSKVYIPRELSGKTGNAVFHLAHRNPGATVHWHLDGNYLGSTKSRHQLPVNPGKGRHKLVLVDDNGESLEEHFEVLSSM